MPIDTPHGLFRRQLAALHRFPRIFVDLRRQRLNGDERQEESQPGQHLVRRRRLRSKSLAEEVKHNRNAQEGRQRHHDGR